MELFIIAIAYLFGIIMGLYFKIGIAFIVAFCIILYIFRKKNRYIKLFCTKKYIILFLVFLLISFVHITYLNKQYNKKYQNVQGKIQVMGTIVSNPIEKENSIIYTLKVEKIDDNKSYQNTKLKLYVKKGKTYKYGDEILLFGEFEEPEIQRNTGGFDYQEYLKTKNIYGIVRANEVELIKQNNVNFIDALVNKIVCKIKQKANTLLPKEEASILIGILIGDKENLEDETQNTFRKSNLSHMLAVSGAHVSYVIMAIGFIVTKTKISKNNGKVVTILLLVFFMLITGKTPSVTRACIMSIYMIVASLFHKRVTAISSMSISLLFLLIQNPYCIFDIGLQLSYGGAIGILGNWDGSDFPLGIGDGSNFPFSKFFNKIGKNKKVFKFIFPKVTEKIKSKKNIQNNESTIFSVIEKCLEKTKEIVLLSLSVNIILIPIMIYHFNTLSLIFLLSNLLASPLLGIIMILGFISIIISFIFLPLAKIICIPLKIALKAFYFIAKCVGNLPFSQVYVPTPPIYMIIIYYLLVAIIILYRKIKNKPQKRRLEKIISKKLKKIEFKKLISAILIILVIFLLYKQIPKNLNIYFIDVGQGDSTLIVTPRSKTILIDGGGSRDSQTYDVGRNTLIPYLLDRGIAKLDYIIISHFDSDHVRTVFYLLCKN